MHGHGCTSRIHGSKSSKYSTDHAHRPTAAPGRAACSTLTAPAREALRLKSLHALSHIMFGFRQQGYCSCSRTRCRLSSKLPSLITRCVCTRTQRRLRGAYCLAVGGWKVIGRVLAAVISRSSPRTASTAKANSWRARDETLRSARSAARSSCLLAIREYPRASSDLLAPPAVLLLEKAC